jgi:hypothetical protein
VEKHSGVDGYILRPLSAKRLPETVPEKAGLVNRELLLGLAGRSRKPQMELAETFGIREYPNPGGGCLLTDKGYSDRLRDLFAHQNDYTENALCLLRYGRHFRLDEHTKMIVGRTQQDNENLIKYHDPLSETVIRMRNIPGPLVLLPEGGAEDKIFFAASVCVGYSKAPKHELCEVTIAAPDRRQILQVMGIPPDEVKGFLI